MDEQHFYQQANASQSKGSAWQKGWLWGDDNDEDKDKLSKGKASGGVAVRTQKHIVRDGRSVVSLDDEAISVQDVRYVGNPCKVIIRSREARTPWENVVKAVVGNPVHVDVVLAKEGSAGAKFCFSSYMNHKFEMVMMDSSLIHDECIRNLSLEVTDQEFERCTRFLSALDGKASYSYFDALVLMPMAPKVINMMQSLS